jgi:hypothetical protein
MTLSLEDINDQAKFRLFLTVPYSNLIQFVFEVSEEKISSDVSLLVSLFRFSVSFSIY